MYSCMDAGTCVIDVLGEGGPPTSSHGMTELHVLERPPQTGKPSNWERERSVAADLRQGRVLHCPRVKVKTPVVPEEK